jgi:hypothetical protein
MIRIEIRNFQSIEHADIQVRGFTALVGRSNIGKSAIVRAVESALTGASGTSFVRHGPTCARRIKGKTCKCFASVHITGDGFDLLWEKGDGVNRYKYNGMDYDAVARGFPEFLKPDFTPVKIGDHQTVIQVAPQWEPIFLLNATGGTVADVLSDVARLDRINVAMRLSEKDRKAAMATLKVRHEDADRLRVALQGYTGLDDAITQANDVAARLKKIEGHNRNVVAIAGFQQTLGVIEGRIQDLEGISSVKPPETQPLLAQTRARIKLTGFAADYTVKSTVVDTLAPVATLQVPAPASMQEALEHNVKVSTWFSKVQVLKGALQKWIPVKDTPIPDSSHLSTMTAAVKTSASLSARLTTLQKAIEGLEAQYATVLEDEKGVQEEVRKLGTCPSCARPFQEGHTHP